ncbi:MAG: M15 family metallopeptidase [Oscillospiraceae bacterium]|nr:M15 family metallopeptidase [Oscillospiraceae bacterium]
MRSAKKEFLTALCLLLLTLAAGVLIQGLLRFRDNRRSDLEARAITDRMLSAVCSYADDIHSRSAEAALRLQNLPREKRERLENLQLDLLTVVSAAQPLQEGYVPELATVIEEYQMDARCADIVMQMILDCQAAGGRTMICSAYRTGEYQQMLYENKVQRVLGTRWMSYEEARDLAAEEVARPGTSEHQLGLAADIIDESYPYLDERQETTFTSLWLKEHAPDYGFILRYPNGTSDITGVIYEPWHYRYVGVQFAKEISKRGITLEEYVAWRRGR